MSPEQCKGDRIDHRSDVYSLGVVTYQMLAGHVPFTAETAVGILMKHLTEPLPIPPKGVALPPAVNGVLKKAMARDVRERFSTAGELAEALTRSADQRATVTLHASGIRRAIPALKLPPWVRRMRSREMRLSLAALTLSGMLAFVYAVWPSPEVPPPDETAHFAAGADEVEVSKVEDSRADAPSAFTRTPEAAAGRVGAPPAVDRSVATLEVEAAERVRVFLDGNPLGTAPGTFPGIAPGEHLIAVDAGGGRREEKPLVVTAGSTHRIRFDLVDAPSGDSRPKAPPATNVALASAGTAEIPEIRKWTGFLTD
ncbi:MAG: serine/threonine protein kinase, partial [Vicinamibacteria bacterium]